jgi:hypothetical protein
MSLNPIDVITTNFAESYEDSATSPTIEPIASVADDSVVAPVIPEVTTAVIDSEKVIPRVQADIATDTWDDGQTAELQPTPDALAEQLARLIDSVALVEELSRSAREAAAGDPSRYEALLKSSLQYRHGLDQATVIRDQARNVLDQAFGQAARAAAEPLLAEAEGVLAALTHLMRSWHEQADGFLTAHPDVELLLAERHAQEQAARDQEVRAERLRRHEALLASVDAALDERVFVEARRALSVFEREFSDDTSSSLARQPRLDQLIRLEHDDVAHEAMLVASEQQAHGDLEGAVNTLERVDIQALSLEVSQDVFGRWCDACSRLAQTSGAQLVRYAPAQGRGLILFVDPARPDELQVFSCLGMGPDYPYGTIITPVIDDYERATPELLDRARKRARFGRTVLDRARSFREAMPSPSAAWGFQAPVQPTAPIHH